MSSIAPIKKIEETLADYLNIVKNKHSEDAKAQTFLDYIKPIFGIELGQLDFQVPTSSTVLNLRGRIDCVFGQTIFEFKKEVNPRNLEVGKKELKKYFQSHYEKSDNNIVGIITDGIKFQVYLPKVGDQKIVDDVELIDELDLDVVNIDPKTIFLWFDAYFFSSDKIIPTSDDIKKRFGLSSPTFQTILKKLEKLYQKCETISYKPTLLKYETWVKYLEVIYGDKLDNKQLFFRHTYLSTFVKLLIYSKLSNMKSSQTSDIIPILFGDVFKNAGLTNFIEDDFFTWITAPMIRKESGEIFSELLAEINSYNLDDINEDILKELYHQLVDDEVRQLLGEFYTPDWLAEHMVLQTKPGLKKVVLDPSCGSGTFLFKTIEYKIRSFNKLKMKESDILKHILDEVIGFDVHPLAVMIAKTNYVLALKQLLNFKRGPVSIPVYLSDTLKTPKKTLNVSTAISTLEFDAADKKFEFPESIAKDLSKMDEIIDHIKNHGKEYEKLKERNPADISQIRQNLLVSFDKAIQSEPNEVKPSLIKNCEVLFDLIDNNNDSIWPFVLRNMYKPISLEANKVDVLIGNPPWLGLQKMKNPIYQDYLKKQCQEYGLATNAQNLTHMDMAALFFYQTTDKYLQSGGIIAFVMPRSVIQSSQHVNFRNFEKPKMKLVGIDDFDFNTRIKVEPLFKIPSCTLYAIKGQKTTYPVPQEIFSGKLQNSNEQLANAIKILKFSHKQFQPINRNFSGGYYYDLFKQGATLVPGCFWFVEPKIDVKSLGFNPLSPYIVTAKNPQAKDPWKSITMEGCVEKQFLYTTIIGTDLLPFEYRVRKLIVLPLEENNGNVEILEHSNMFVGATDGMKEWLTDAETLWRKHSTAKSKNMSIYERINRNSGLTQQKPNSKFKVLYNRSGAYMAACVAKNEKTSFDVNGINFTVDNGLIGDSTTYHFDTDSENEAYYLSAILNSGTMNNFITPFQSKGKFGGRDIHKIPLEYPIPKYDEKNNIHRQLSTLGLQCEAKIPSILKSLSTNSIGIIRSKIRDELKQQYQEIDKLIKIFNK